MRTEDAGRRKENKVVVIAMVIACTFLGEDVGEESKDEIQVTIFAIFTMRMGRVEAGWSSERARSALGETGP